MQHVSIYYHIIRNTWVKTLQPRVSSALLKVIQCKIVNPYNVCTLAFPLDSIRVHDHQPRNPGFNLNLLYRLTYLIGCFISGLVINCYRRRVLSIKKREEKRVRKSRRRNPRPRVYWAMVFSGNRFFDFSMPVQLSSKSFIKKEGKKYVIMKTKKMYS